MDGIQEWLRTRRPAPPQEDDAGRSRRAAATVDQPPAGCPEGDWDQEVARLLAWYSKFRVAGTSFMLQRITAARTKAAAEGRVLTLADVEQEYLDYRPHGDAEAEYRSRGLPKVRGIRQECAEFGYERGMDLAQFIRKRQSVIFEPPVEDDLKSLFTGYLLLFLFETLNRNPDLRGTTIYFIADEATYTFRSRPGDASLPLPAKLITLVAGIGCSVIALSQNPSLLLPGLKSNSGVAFVFRNVAQEAVASAQLVNAGQELAAEIPRMKTGQCLMRVAGPRLKGPVLVDVDRFPADRAPSREELERISAQTVQPLRDGVKKADVGEEAELTPVRAKPQRDPDRVSADAELLLHRYEAKPMVMRLVAEDLKWSSSKLSRETAEIIKAGIWSTGDDFGHNNKQYLLTERGRQYCERWRIPLAREKSGRPHDRTHQIVTNTAERIIAQRVPGARFQSHATFQVSPNRQVQVDRLIVGPGRDGMRVGMQTAHHNTVQYEATNLARLGGMGDLGPDAILCVASSAGHRDALQRGLDRLLAALQARDGSGEWAEQVRARIRLTHIDEVMAATFDLSWLTRGGA